MKINTIKEALKKIKFPIEGEFKVGHTAAYTEVADEKLFGNKMYYNGTINSWEHLYDIFKLDKDRLVMQLDPYNISSRDTISIDMGTADIMFCFNNYEEGTRHPTIRPTKTLVFPKIDGKSVFIHLLEDIKDAEPDNDLDVMWHNHVDC